MVLLSIALLLGIISFFPVVGILFAFCSIPVYVRFAQQRANVDPTVQTAARMTASVGVMLSVIAASLGAFFGTCHASAFLTMTVVERGNQDLGFVIAVPLFVGVLIGLISAGFAIVKLWPLAGGDPPVVSLPDSIDSPPESTTTVDSDEKLKDE